jgi:hypothetical protein
MELLHEFLEEELDLVRSELRSVLSNPASTLQAEFQRWKDIGEYWIAFCGPISPSTPYRAFNLAAFQRPLWFLGMIADGNALDAAPCSLEYPRGLAALFKAEPVLSAEEYAICGLRGVKAVLEHNADWSIGDSGDFPYLRVQRSPEPPDASDPRPGLQLGPLEICFADLDISAAQSIGASLALREEVVYSKSSKSSIDLMTADTRDTT